VEPIHLRDERCLGLIALTTLPTAGQGDEHGGKVRPAAHAGWTSGLAGHLRPGHDPELTDPALSARNAGSVCCGHQARRPR
jgi:hypothetical protein